MFAIILGKLLSLNVLVCLGWLLVRFQVLEPKDSRVLSVLSLYLLMPCVILNSFQVTIIPQVRQGLAIALAAVVVTHALLLLLNRWLHKPLGLGGVDQASVLYPNVANLTIPLAGATLGPESAIYTSPFIAVQILLLWSHGKALLSGQRQFHLRAMLCNADMLAIGAGLVLLANGWTLPKPVQDMVDTLAGLFSPISMLSAGILVGHMNLKKVFSCWRTWRSSLLRLVGGPMVALGVCKIFSLCSRAQAAQNALLVVYMIWAMPPAISVIQFSQVYGQDARHASGINLLSTLLCILTLPLMLTLYQMI